MVLSITPSDIGPMDNNFRKQLKVLLHPYAFVLKEGQGIKGDLMDYSLLILQLDCCDRLKSPSLHHLLAAKAKAEAQTEEQTAPVVQDPVLSSPAPV
jgi:hypothetical protein